AEVVAAYAAAETEETVERIAVEQLARLDAELGRDAAPAEIAELSSDLGYRNDLLGELKAVHDLARLAREGGSWRPPDGPSGPAREALVEGLPWRVVAMHARIVPFWTARDVDGLETICRAAGVLAPDCLGPAWRLFAEACEAHPALRDALKLEMTRPR